MSDTNHFHGYLRMLHKDWKPSVNSPNFNDVEYGFSYAVYQDELTGSDKLPLNQEFIYIKILHK